ncbi:MAG TPA: DsbE family thiol:disulfide interchange protein [Acetobacteraceae bacterium]|nr:DsbE family thiol:disulfide interchange protein [Acetobacteraceae bacterium]
MDAITRRRLLMLAPLGVAAAALGGAWGLLLRMQRGSYDPHSLPSMLVGKPLPQFALPGQPPSTGFSNADVIAAKQPALVNFFASWCIPCIQEAPTLAALHQQGVSIWGIAYKDKVAAAAAFLREHGDPYVRVARDEPGRVAIDFGVYGVPETYVVDAGGIVRLRYAGGLSEDVVRTQIAPLLKSLA